MNNTTNKMWQERFTWFWFNEDELLRYSEEDFRLRARELSDRGVTVAINFSLSHFRASFYPYLDVIHGAMKKFVDACHEVGIKVVEHHSASLVHNLLSKAGWGRIEEDLGSFSNWTATIDTWIDVPRFLVCDPAINGKRYEDMFQIDGRTGKVADTVYDCHAFCYNNPDYRDMYFSYMKKLLRDVDIDGIMNDDVQYFADGNACACPHCRKLFKEEYGFDLPSPDGWDAFYGDYENPAFVAWERFKRGSTERFYRDLGVMYEALGKSLMRPNYSSSVLMGNGTAYGFDRCCDVWNYIFQENCFSAVIKNSYMDFGAEAIHRFSVAARNGVPSMSMFYPDRTDTVYFAWALCKMWGQLYTGTSEGVDITAIEAKYREFENVHAAWLCAPRKLEDIAFYFSMQTRDYVSGAAERYMQPFVGAMQAAAVCGLGCEMVFEGDSVDELCRHECIVAHNVALISDEEISKLKEYVSRGGRLIIIGEFGKFDATSAKRDCAAAIRAFGISAEIAEKKTDGEVTLCNNTALSNVHTDVVLTNAHNPVAYAGENVVGASFKIGTGELVWLPIEFNESEYQPSIWANRRQKNPPREVAVPSKRIAQMKGSGAVLRTILGKQKADVECAECELLHAAYEVAGGYAIHIVNTTGTLQAADVGHEDKIPAFSEGAAKIGEIKIGIEAPNARAAVLYSPELDEGVTLAIMMNNGRAEITVPRDTFAGYALITIEI